MDEHEVLEVKQILVELDDETAARLEKVAPARSRQRSEFIRQAIRRAIWDLEEKATEESYRRLPDTEPVYLEREVWDAWEVREGTAKAGAKAGAKGRRTGK